VNWLQEKEIESVEMSDICTYLKHRVSNGKARTTVGVDLSAIKNLYTWMFLETEKDVEINYPELDAIDISKLQFPDPISREPLETEELELLYEHMNCFRDRLITTVAAETGARNSDVRRITLSRLDLKAEDPQIKLTNTKEGGTYTAYISKSLATEIEYYIDQRRPAYPSYEDFDYLFLSNEGGKLSSDRFTRIVRNAAERAGIQSVIGTQVQRRGNENVENNLYRVTPHTLRHTFNNMLEKEDVPAEHRAKALDQDSVEVNREYYSHEDIDYAKFVKRLHGS
jgi:integrase/recombinase XerD